jgi:SpoVK/Ycf46/Vps4 family AAA+-type ATPase
MKKAADEITTHYRSRYPILWIITYEEARAVEAVDAASQELKVPYAIWSGPGWGATGAPTLHAGEDPMVAVEEVAKAGAPAIFVLKDFHAYFDEPRLLRRVRDLIPLLLSRGQMVVILSPVLRIPVEIEKDVAVFDMPLPGDEELQNIFNSVMVERQVIFPEEFVHMAIRAARGLTADEAHRAFLKALVRGGDAELDDIDAIVEEKRKIIRRYEVLEFVDSDDSMESIGGLAELKRFLGLREKAFSEDARRFGLPAPKGLLLCGVQGCGKSLTARAVARLWKLPLIRLDLGSIFSANITPEEGLRRAIKVAVSLAPAVLWIDEIEKGFIGVAANTGTDNAATRAFGMFITWMQEKKDPVFVIATANEVANLPPELLRKGRFDEIFFIDLPDVHEREEILRVHIRTRGRDPAAYDLRLLSDLTEHFSGAEIEQVVVAALFRAFNEGRDLVGEDLSKSIKETVPLYQTYEDKIKGLREWASTRTRMASVQSRVLDYFGADAPKPAKKK